VLSTTEPVISVRCATNTQGSSSRDRVTDLFRVRVNGRDDRSAFRYHPLVGKVMVSLIVSVVGGVIVALLVAYWHIGGSRPTANVSQGNAVTSGSSLASSATETPRPGPTGQCGFLYPTYTSCTSTNPHVELYDNNIGDTSGCIFEYKINWGDGSPVESLRYSGAAVSGTFPVADHAYGSKGTYSIHMDEAVTSGLCYPTPGNYSFTWE